jgi:Cdc6-like AAA superfamily ATPase
MTGALGDLFRQLPQPMSDGDWFHLDYRASDIFSPHAPIDEEQLFVGRSALIDGLVETVFQRGQHAILYGERGVGKTSLANILKDKVFAKSRRFKFIKRNCTATHSFMTIWKHLLDDTKDGDGDTLDEYVDHLTDGYGIYRIVEKFPPNLHPVFIIDEYDRISDPKTHEKMADTIKYLSDYSSPATLIIVGVARDVRSLFGGHPSIERNVRQLPMPAMNTKELNQIFDKRLPDLGMTIVDNVLDTLITLAQGLPGYTHLLGQLSARNAIRDKRLVIEMKDLDGALIKAIDNCDEKIKDLYARAVQSTRPANQYREVLLACALAPIDARGFFTASGVREPFSKIMKRQMDIPHFARHLNEFCRDDHGPAILKDGRPKSYMYRFSDALLRPFVVIKGVNDNLIPKMILKPPI